MRLSLLIFTVGIIFISTGYIQQLDPKCRGESEVRIVPRNVYDQLIKDATL
mgnify:CR=1 FL=1